MTFFKNTELHNKSHGLITAKLTAKGLCFIMLATMALSVVYSITIQDIKQTQTESINSIKNEQFNSLYKYMTIIYNDASKNASITADNIENDIRTIVDIGQLEADIKNGIRNQELHEIIRKNISRKNLNGVANYRNGIFVANTSGIIEDLSYSRSSKNNEPRTWDYEIENSFNSTLERNAISKILNQSRDIIVSEHVDLISDPSHKLITTGTKDQLQQIYMEEGLEGFKNYQFLAPAYITEEGDIFGQLDIVDGKRNKTSKIIVIQEFNLYDQILKNYPDFASDNSIDALNNQYTNILNWLYALGCLYVICIILSLIYISTIYNNFIEHYGLIDEE